MCAVLWHQKLVSFSSLFKWVSIFAYADSNSFDFLVVSLSQERSRTIHQTLVNIKIKEEVKIFAMQFYKVNSIIVIPLYVEKSIFIC